MAPLASVVDTDALLQTVWVALVAGVEITVAFAFALLGLARAQETRDAGDALRVGLYGLLGIARLSVVGAGIVLGLIGMTRK